MPHCIIEVTDNILSQINAENFMQEVAGALNDAGCFIPDDIKIRIRPIELSCLGLEKQEHSYIATDIQVLNNKTEALYKEILNKVHSTIVFHFKNLIGKNSITTKLTLMEEKYYSRNVNY